VRSTGSQLVLVRFAIDREAGGSDASDHGGVLLGEGCVRRAASGRLEASSGQRIPHNVEEILDRHWDAEEGTTGSEGVQLRQHVLGLSLFCGKVRGDDKGGVMPGEAGVELRERVDD